MILVDANLLLYAYDASSSQHAAARQWWEGRLSDSPPVGLAWATVLAFLRISTHPRLLAAPFTIDEARDHVQSWFDQPQVTVLEPTERHWEILGRLLVAGQASGNLVPDAHLAALAVEHGATLCSTDGDFSRFAAVVWDNPISRYTGIVQERLRAPRPRADHLGPHDQEVGR